MKTKLSRVIFLGSVLLVVGAGCSSQTVSSVNTNVEQTPPSANSGQATPSSTVADYPAATEVNYFVPENIPEYMRIEEAYAQVGKGADPSYKVVYITKTVAIKPTEISGRTAVQAAVALLPTEGGPPHANVVYFKYLGKTAYVLLDVDFDGWAGVSAFEAAVHPVIIENLMVNSIITKVVFGPAPGDTMEQIGSALSKQNN